MTFASFHSFENYSYWQIRNEDLDPDRFKFFSQSIKGPHDLYTYLYVNELMMRLLPKGLPNQELYDLYKNFVELARADAISELDLRAF